MNEGDSHQLGFDRRRYPRLKASFDLRVAICGNPGEALPGYARNLGLGGISFVTAETEADVGSHVALEIAVPGYEDPLYVIGEIVRVADAPDDPESRLVACRFDWLGKTDLCREKLAVLTGAHSVA